MLLDEKHVALTCSHICAIKHLAHAMQWHNTRKAWILNLFGRGMYIYIGFSVLSFVVCGSKGDFPWHKIRIEAL